MQLKRVELQGFKSFADKTVIEVESGVTTIVGPNGSGKSNISDAIRWVLGEQSAKSLRGGTMQDVIFAGTEQRRMLGLAEVTLVLDNSDQTLNVPFNEVTITRRVYRTGESEYEINKSQCRLKDIQELFMDTGVGRDGYSIIGQGKIDNIISSKSEERRNIFEEASGIVKYRTRKDEALRKLENTKINLDRVSDILREIEANLGPLEEKSKVAKKYLEIRDELKNVDIALFIDLIDNTDSDLGKLNMQLDSLDESITKNEEEKLLVQRLSNENRVSLEEILADTHEKQETYYKTLNERDKIVSKIEAYGDRLEVAKENIAKLKEEIIENKASIQLLQQEMINRASKKELMMQNKEKFVKELQDKEKQAQEIISNMSDRELEIDKLKNSCDEIKDKINEYKVYIAECNAKIDGANARLVLLDKSNTKDISSTDAISIEKQEIKDEYDKLKHEKESALKELEEALEKKKELEVFLSGTTSKEADYKQQIIEAKSKLNYMTNLENENAGYVSSVKAIIDLAKRNSYYTDKVYGTLASLIATDEKYEKAIETAMGAYLQNIVVDSDKSAKELISFLKDGMLGRATFLPISSIRLYKEDIPKSVLNQKGYVGMAVDLVRFDAKFEAAVRLGLGRTIIVENIDDGIKLSKITKSSAKIVTLQGEVISTTGSITGGQAVTKQTSLVGRKRKLNEYTERLKLIEKEYNEFLESFKDKKDIFDKLVVDIENYKQIASKASIDFGVIEEKLSHVIKEGDKLADSRRQKAQEKDELNVEIARLEEEIQRVNLEIENMNLSKEKMQQEIDEYTRFNKEKERNINNLKEDIVNLKISVSSFDDSTSSIEEMVEKIKEDIAGFESSITRKEQLIQEYENTLSMKDIESNEEKSKVEILGKEAEALEKQIEQLKEEKNINIEKQISLEKQLLDIVGTLDKLKQEKAKVENKKSKYDAEVEMLKAKMWEEYELTISGAREAAKALESILGVPKNKLEQRASKLKSEIKGLGEVTVSSIEEFKELSERHAFIKTQKIDLEDAKLKLENLIDNTTSIMKMQFANHFEIINSNFKSVFTELFGGGKAELKLVDPSNVLESGIEIEAQPPGKKLQSISLLSGGEKALTAIAILFAILKIKAPPFCILDEIEAALDDVNVARFASYIKKYSDETQFLIITHRKGTMEIASSVYGVTMQEYGISKLISMKMK